MSIVHTRFFCGCLQKEHVASNSNWIASQMTVALISIAYHVCIAFLLALQMIGKGLNADAMLTWVDLSCWSHRWIDCLVLHWRVHLRRRTIDSDDMVCGAKSLMYSSDGMFDRMQTGQWSKTFDGMPHRDRLTTDCRTAAENCTCPTQRM